MPGPPVRDAPPDAPFLGADAAFSLAPPSRRRPSRAIAGLLVMLLSAMVAATLYLRADQRTTVLTVGRHVPAGHAITDADLSSARVAVSGIPTLPVSERAEVLGKIATVDLLAGSLLNPQMLTTQAVPGPGQAIVGVAVRPGQLPAGGLEPGDPVQVVRTPTAGGETQAAVTVLSDRAVVYEVQIDEETSIASVSLLVSGEDAPRVAQASAVDEVSLVLLPRARA